MGISVILYVILSFLVSFTLIGLSIKAFDITIMCNYLLGLIETGFSFPSPRLTMFCIGLLILLFCLRYMEAGLRQTRRDKSIPFESDQGSVKITLLAIEDMLKKMLEERPEVSHVKPRVRVKKKCLEINIKGVLTAEVNLVDFIQDIQKKIKEKMDKFLGEDKTVKVNLEIRKVAIGNKGNVQPEPEPEIPFRNYE